MNLRRLTVIVLPFLLHCGCVFAADSIQTVLTPEQIKAEFRAMGKTVVTFVGYSGAEYENRNKMLLEANRVLSKLDPKHTIVDIGVSSDGVGAIYALAKKMGFETTGIESSLGKKYGHISPWVDHIYYVDDPTWGGFKSGTHELSPTSRAIVGVSDEIIGIGGGDVAKDELLAAREMGKDIIFYSADMNHAIAIQKALKKGLAPPTDFKGPAETSFGWRSVLAKVSCIEKQIHWRLLN